MLCWILSLVIFWFFLVDRSIQTWHWPTSLQYQLWHFLWCEWGRIHSYPTQEVYCFGLRRLTLLPLRHSRAVTLCRRRLLSAYIFPSIYGQNMIRAVKLLKQPHLTIFNILLFFIRLTFISDSIFFLIFIAVFFHICLCDLSSLNKYFWIYSEVKTVFFFNFLVIRSKWNNKNIIGREKNVTNKNIHEKKS